MPLLQWIYQIRQSQRRLASLARRQRTPVFSARLEVLEDRILPANDLLADPDPRDFYWYFDQKMPLIQRTDELVLSFRDGVLPDLALQPLLAEGGLLEGWKIKFGLGRYDGHDPCVLTYVPQDSAAHPHSFASAQQLSPRLAALPEIAWATPTYKSVETGGYYIVGNEIIVCLRPDVDPQQFLRTLGTGYASYEYLWGPPATFIITLANGSGRATLEAADRFTQRPEVAYSEPNAWIQVFIWEPPPPAPIATVIIDSGSPVKTLESTVCYAAPNVSGDDDPSGDSRDGMPTGEPAGDAPNNSAAANPAAEEDHADSPADADTGLLGVDHAGLTGTAGTDPADAAAFRTGGATQGGGPVNAAVADGPAGASPTGHLNIVFGTTTEPNVFNGLVRVILAGGDEDDLVGAANSPAAPAVSNRAAGHDTLRDSTKPNGLLGLSLQDGTDQDFQTVPGQSRSQTVKWSDLVQRDALFADDDFTSGAFVAGS